MDIMGILEKGGVLIYPLLVLGVWAVIIVVVKAVALRRSRTVDPGVIVRIEQLLLNRKLMEATSYCHEQPLPITRMLHAAIVNYEKPEAELKAILEEAGRQEIPRIRSHLSTLGTIASVAPLLGLLGTVLGMISVFATLSDGSNIDPSMLAGGISEALITPALGMIIAMPTLACYNYFATRIQNLIIEMERVSLHMVSVLKRLAA